MKNVLWWLIVGSRGGNARASIIQALKERPYTAAQLAEHVQMDYTTVRYHLRILEENNVSTGAGKKYGETYALTPQMEANYPLFEEILQKIGKTPESGKKVMPPATPPGGGA